MKHGKTPRLLAGALALSLVALAVQTGCARNTRWQKASAAGQKALQEGRYAEAQLHLTAALKDAEGFGEQAPRPATSLSNLAALYRAHGKYAQAKPL
ncbi:MAG: tetratricopeptide repeat protein [Terriglobia bacterium]